VVVSWRKELVVRGHAGVDFGNGTRRAGGELGDGVLLLGGRGGLGLLVRA
jgi:hypothetical protein